MDGVVLSGGADNGAYEVGVLLYLAEKGHLENVKVMGCTSIGSANGAYMGQWPSSEALTAARMLVEVWKQRLVNPRSVRVHRFPPWVAALWCPSIFKTHPYWNLLQDLIDVEKVRKSGNKIIVTATSLERAGQNGRHLQVFDQDHPNFLRAVFASGAIPLGFEPVDINGDGELWVDGYLDTAPLSHVIRAGAEKVFVVVAQNKARARPSSYFTTGPRVLMRSIELYGDETLREDLKRCRRTNEDVDAGRGRPGHRRVETVVIEPSADLGDSTDFDPANARRNIDLGYEDARRVLERRG